MAEDNSQHWPQQGAAAEESQRWPQQRAEDNSRHWPQQGGPEKDNNQDWQQSGGRAGILLNGWVWILEIGRSTAVFPHLPGEGC